HSIMGKEVRVPQAHLATTRHIIWCWANVRLLRVALTGDFRSCRAGHNYRASGVADMPAETVAFASPTSAPKRRNHRRARKPFDGRNVLGRRVRELTSIFKARLGEVASDPVTAAAIRRAAETVALSEDLRARMLRGE